MKRILNLIWMNFRFCFIRMLEFRTEALIWSVNGTTWSVLAFSAVYLIFGQVNSIAGWTKNEALLIAVTCSIFNSILWWNVYPSILHFVDTIRTGHFDFYLLKPVNTRLLVSISRFEFDQYIRVPITAAIGIAVIMQNALPVTPAGIGMYLVLFGLGLFIYYCLFFLIASLAFRLIELDEMEHLLDTLVTSGRFPTNIFNHGLRLVFFYIIPLAFVATFPVQVLLGKSGIELVVLGLLMAIIFFIASEMVWQHTLRHYSSASS